MKEEKKANKNKYETSILQQQLFQSLLNILTQTQCGILVSFVMKKKNLITFSWIVTSCDEKAVFFLSYADRSVLKPELL